MSEDSELLHSDEYPGNIHLATWPHQKQVFYKITSHAIKLYIKGHSNALIGLAKKPQNSCEVTIVLGDQISKTSISLKGEKIVTYNTPNVLSPTEFRQFYLSWEEGKLLIRDSRFSCSYQNPVPIDLFYITLGVKLGNHPVYYEFTLPPRQIFKSLKPIVTSSEMEWQEVQLPLEELPKNAVIGGFDKDSLYVMRGHHQGSLTPGTYSKCLGNACIAWGGQCVLIAPKFEILCGINCQWVKTTSNQIPVNAIVGGYSEVLKERLYIGRTYHNDQLIIGKVQPSHKCMYIPAGGKEVGYSDYEILIKPKDKDRSYNNHRYMYACFDDSQRTYTDDEENYDDDSEDEYPVYYE